MGKCQICGKTTKFNYPLCLECNQKKEQGLIVQDENGKWTIKEEPKNNSSELTCLICGEPCYPGKHFCHKCWEKYRNKDIYVLIKGCKTPTGEPYNAEYESPLTAKDGHVVKSHPERDIDNYLYDNGIKHAYEYIYDVDGKPEHEFKPDFYLKDYLGTGKDVFIEYFGMKGTTDGDRKIKYKMPIYKRDKKTVICLYQKDDKNIESALNRKLNKEKIIEKEVNFEEK